MTFTYIANFNANFVPTSDNAYNIGSPTFRVKDYQGATATLSGLATFTGGFTVGSDQKLVRETGNFFSISPTDANLVAFPTSANNGMNLSIAPSGISNVAQLAIYRTSDRVTNSEVLGIASDLAATNIFSIQVQKNGSGSLRPLVFWMATTEIFRFQVASPYIKFNEGTTGAATATAPTNSPAATNTNPYTWLKVASADGSTVYIPAWK